MLKTLFARPTGELIDFPGMEFAAMNGTELVFPTEDELIPLPEGATLCMMTEHAPIGRDPEDGEIYVLEENPYKKKPEQVCAVAALLPQGYTRTLLPAAELEGRDLPLLGYTAVCMKDDEFFVAAVQSDEQRKWKPTIYNTPQLEQKIAKVKQLFPKNRIVKQLAKCSLEYGCFTAENIFYHRYEAGIPVSPACNADCLGCISLQPSECCPSPQQRISFAPTPQEIAELGIYHLKEAKEAIISFGQGCEGEPSLQYKNISEAIRLIRAETECGTININTNAGNTEAIKALIEAGMDSFRVSLFSARTGDYAAYHRPLNYSLDDVKASMRLMQQAGRYHSLNLLTYPGFTDTPSQVEALIELINEYGVDLVQFRNLNLDPQAMLPFLPDEQGMGIENMLARLREACPETELGSFSRNLK
ncbi:MAG: radical SAM protein [Firmicutes bacterium]|nr:radical SAM protein [Bacillota bacterium]